MKKKLEKVEVIQFSENGELVYHRKPASAQYQFYKSKLIPTWLFELYLQRRSDYQDTRRKIRRYFVALKDKPMRVEKNHIGEGEVHRFHDDGTVTVTGKED